MSSISKDLLYDHGPLVVVTVPAKNKKAHRGWSQERRHSVCAAPCWLRRLTRAALSMKFSSPHTFFFCLFLYLRLYNYKFTSELLLLKISSNRVIKKRERFPFRSPSLLGYRRAGCGVGDSAPLADALTQQRSQGTERALGASVE